MTISEIGGQIKDRRKVLRIIQPDLAEMAGISINTLYKIERGQANPPLTRRSFLNDKTKRAYLLHYQTKRNYLNQ